MKILKIKKEIFKQILNEYFEFCEYQKYYENNKQSYSLEPEVKKQIEKMFFKLTDFVKETIAKNIDVIFYVKNEDSFTDDPLLAKINDVSNPAKLYLYYLMLCWSISDEYFPDEIEIVISECDYKRIKALKIINAALFSIDFTKKGFNLDLEKMNSLYKYNPKDIIKNAKKHIISSSLIKK